jgi:hypothetical protein
MFELYVVLCRRGYPLSRRILLFTTGVVDLSWADDDELGANDNLLLYVDTYKLLCSCVHHPQSTLPPTSHPLQPPTPLAWLQPFDRIFSLAGKPPDYVHVPGCQPREKSHGLLPRVSPSFPSRSNPLTLPASAAPSTFSPPVLAYVRPLCSSPSLGGTGRNPTTGATTCTNQKHKSSKVRQPPSCCILGKDIATDRVSNHPKRALVGNFHYSKMPKARLMI